MTDRLRNLEAAYRNARYRIDDDGAPLELGIGEPSPRAAALLARRGVAGAALITACNPGSRPTAEADNRRAQLALEAAVAAGGWPWLPGAGLDPDGHWPPEPGLLVLGIEPAAARELAGRFGQNALVWIGADGAPALLWTGRAARG